MTILCSEGQYDNARAQLPDLYRNGKGERRGIDWGFNAWGGEVDGLYPSWENDNRVARKFCDLLAGTRGSNDDCILFSIECVHRNNLSLARLVETKLFECRFQASFHIHRANLQRSKIIIML